MDNIQTGKKFDLEERTLSFTKKVIDLIKRLPKNTVNFEMSSQVMRIGRYNQSAYTRIV